MHLLFVRFFLFSAELNLANTRRMVSNRWCICILTRQPAYPTKTQQFQPWNISYKTPTTSIGLTSVMYLQPQLDLFSYLHPHKSPALFSYVKGVSCGIVKWASFIDTALKSSSVMTLIGGVSIRGASDSSRGKSTWNIILSTQLCNVGPREISAIGNKREYIFYSYRNAATWNWLNSIQKRQNAGVHIDEVSKRIHITYTRFDHSAAKW